MSSILNNASLSLGLKALQSCRRQSPYQKKLGILHLPYASYTPNDLRHFTKSSLNPFTAVEEAFSEQVLPSGRSDRLIYWRELRLKALNSFISQSSPKVSCTSIATSISATGSWKSRTDHSKNTENELFSIKANSKAKADQAAVDNVKTPPNAGLEKASPWEISSYREEPIYEKDGLIKDRKESEEKKNFREKEFSQALRRSLPDIAHGDYVNTNTLSHILKIFLSESSATPPRSKISDEQDLAVLSRVFRKNALRELSKRGYLPEDVAVWAWILSAQSSIRAALRLFLWNRQMSPPRRAPLFILKLLLHRPHLEVRAYRILLSCALSYLLCQPLRSTTSDSRFVFANAPPEPESVILKANEASPLITILLRRSREMLPTAQINIAEAYAHFLLNLLPLSEYGAAQWEVNRLQAEGFNSCLRLLGIPSEIQPLTSTFHQQQAQFELLKSMAAHKPVIPVSRQGYQAIVAVQMAHVKTPAEKIFAKQKALSWPPWKEARMGIDAERGNEGMQSRAMQVLSQMTEAGYCHTTWDDVAGILAGWDTDGTPTIQTRSLARPQKALASGIKQSKINSIVWASRIRATRTLREAWACFLSYEARYAVASEPVYHAMARKLIYQQQESDHIFTTDEILPGDGYEVFPEPSSARDVTYVPTEPPTLEELLERMLLQGILPGPDFVAVLIRYAPDIPTGLRYIAAFLSPKQTKAIITLSSQDFTAESANILQLMKPSLFNSIIAFFCAQSRFSGRLKHLRKADHFPILMPRPTRVEHYTIMLLDEENLQGEDGTGNPHTLSHAVKLLLATRPQRVAAWLPLLKALGSPLRWIEDRSTKPHVHWFSAWYEASIVIRWMQELELEPGMEGFITVCQIYARAVRVGIHDVTAADASLASVQEMSRLNNRLHIQVDTEFESFVNRGLRMLKSYFDRLVLPMPPTLSNQNASGLESVRLNTSELIGQAGLGVPDMIQVPTPSALHEFVRALGTAEDHNGILELLEWMSRHAIEIAERADQRPGGRRMLRRTLTAIRVFLEDLNAFKMSRRQLETLVNKEATFDFYHRMEGADENISQDCPVFTDPRVEEAYMLIEKAGVWGSWPSNDEVRVYLERNVHSRE